MANYTLAVPAASLVSPTSWNKTRKDTENMLRKIWANYGGYIKSASEMTKVPATVIASFIAVESGGVADAGLGRKSITTGLMQWNRSYANDILKVEKNKGRLSQAEQDKLKSFGITFAADGSTRELTIEDQLKPELNILMGAISIGQKIDSIVDSNVGKWGTDPDGKLRLDRIVAVYNAGAYAGIGKAARLGNYATPYALKQAILALPEKEDPYKQKHITAAYIEKVLGTNGAMDVATKELKDLIPQTV